MEKPVEIVIDETVDHKMVWVGPGQDYIDLGRLGPWADVVRERSGGFPWNVVVPEDSLACGAD